MQIPAERALCREAHRATHGKGDLGMRGRFGGNLHGGVPTADDHALPGERDHAPRGQLVPALQHEGEGAAGGGPDPRTSSTRVPVRMSAPRRLT
ncbi:hypothetical protein ACIPC1_37135 [Streptomyces sp. NPDC087263]|uniref:hypothetical protein n=1 Tax=Streptomyces sp. NPDC087263 TaxID=3365773 RepID=UPI003815184A